jgi:hypothetical protein
MFRKLLLPLLVIPVLFSVLVQAAPAPWGFAINLEKRECGNFWPGDEYVIYKLQDGWEYYTSYDKIQETTTDEGQGISFETVAGTCNLKDEKAYSRNDYTECCRNLGLSVVDVPKDKSDGPATSLQTVAQVSPIIIILIVLVCVVFLGILAGVIFLLIKRSKGNK